MKETTFKIGLVGAGAISAGAYTGGVVDFMVQALDEWQAAKDNNQPVPPHGVELSVFTGASAGAITAALAVGYLGSDQPPILSEEDGLKNGGRNKLFDSWVERIDIAQLLEHRDLDDESALVRSLLDSTVLSEIADSGLAVQPRASRRPYLADPFELILTVTNLRGVPYAFEVIGNQVASYDMSLHADYIHFRFADAPAPPLPDRTCLRWTDLGAASPGMEQLKIAALASGAFPVGLSPRTLEHLIKSPSGPNLYSSRLWPIPTPESHDPHRCRTLEPIPPSWGTLPPDFHYQFQCVDGGVMNNEPFELARRILAGKDQVNPRRGDQADRAVLLIDPFPSTPSFDPAYKPAPDLLKMIFGLFGALKNQARFKPEELMLAAHEGVYSRFMIAPSRGGAPYPIACGALGGFGGFLKRDFRSHDYFLGRRNAQKFFRDHFALPENNPLFAGWTAEMKEKQCARDQRGLPKTADRQRLMRIIPLVGSAAQPCFQAAWPIYTPDEMELLAGRIEDRVGLVLDRLVQQYFQSNNPLVRLIAKMVMGRKKKDLVNYARQLIEADLKKMEIMG